MPAHPKYPNVQPIFSLLDVVAHFSASQEHTFWTDRISFGNATILDRNHALTSGNLPDVYLLALAVKHQGRLVTLDQHISVGAVNGALKKNLVTLRAR